MRCYDCLRLCDDRERNEWFIGADIKGVKRIDVPRCPRCFDKLVHR